MARYTRLLAFATGLFVAFTIGWYLHHTSPAANPIAMQQPRPSGWDADLILGAAFEYDTPTHVSLGNLFGPAPREYDCSMAGAAASAQLPDLETVKPLYLYTTCLRVKLHGPITKGYVVMQPVVKGGAFYTSAAIEFDEDGNFVGAQLLHNSKDATGCQKSNEDVLKTNQAEGKVPDGYTLLIYCMDMPRGGIQPDGGVL